MRILDRHAGQPELAQSMPCKVGSVVLDDEILAELGCSVRDDGYLTGQITATSNQIFGLLVQIHPALKARRLLPGLAGR